MRPWKDAAEVIGRSSEARYGGMSYEEGVIDAILWVYGTATTNMDEPDEWPFVEEES